MNHDPVSLLLKLKWSQKEAWQGDGRALVRPLQVTHDSYLEDEEIRMVGNLVGGLAVLARVAPPPGGMGGSESLDTCAQQGD